MPKRKYPKPEIEYLRSRIHYNPDTGELVWRDGNFKGQLAFNCVQSAGYLQGNFEYQKFLAHHVAFAHYHGYWPDEVDHIDHDKYNMRISNLREVTGQQNSQNLPKPKNNTSEVMGVSWNKRDRVWQVKIRYKDRLIHVGQFKDKQQAELRAKAAYFLYGFHDNHGL